MYAYVYVFFIPFLILRSLFALSIFSILIANLEWMSEYNVLVSFLN